MRIASLLSSSTEMLFALGLGEQVVAISHECDFPPAARQKPRVTRTTLAADAASGRIDEQVRELIQQGRPLYELDVARLAQLQPDLIVTQAQCDVCAIRHADVLDAVATTPALRHARVVSLNPQSLEDVLADVLRIGAAADRAEAARQYVAALRERIERIAQVSRQLELSQRPRVACIEWVDPPMIAGNWVPELIDLAGGKQNLATPGEHSTYANWEAVRAFDPEIIVIAPCGFDLARTLAEWPAMPRLPGWAELAAVRASRVYAVDGNAYFNRSGPRLIDSLEILAHLIHPDRFTAPAAAAAWQRVPG